MEPIVAELGTGGRRGDAEKRRDETFSKQPATGSWQGIDILYKKSIAASCQLLAGF